MMGMMENVMDLRSFGDGWARQCISRHLKDPFISYILIPY
jgi:hypothetical protein